MKTKATNRFSRLAPAMFAAVTGTGMFATPAFAGGTIVTNNTGISAASFTFMDNGAASIISIGTPNGADVDNLSYGEDAPWASSISVDYPFTGLTANSSYNVYATWHFGGSTGMVATEGANTVGTVNQGNAPSPGVTGFTAYDDVNDATPIETRNFEFLGTATTDGSGSLTINASKAAGYGFVRWDCFAVAPVPVFTDYYWDGPAGNPNGASDGGNGTWNNSNINWDTGSSVAWSNSTLNSAIFGGTAGVVTLLAETTITANGLVFDTSGYTLSGGTINLGGSATITANQNATIDSVLGGTGLTKEGTGDLILGGNNPYTGATLINAGTLSVATLPDGSTAGPLGQSSNAAANLVLAGGTLSYTGATTASNRGFTLNNSTTSTIAVTDANAALTLSGPVAGNGDLVKAGPGTLVRSAAAMGSYTSLSVAEGELSVQTGVFNSLNMTAPVTIAAGAVLSADNTANNAHNMGALTLDGGTLTSVNGPAGPANDAGYGNWVVGSVNVGGSVPSTISSSTLEMKKTADPSGTGTGIVDVADVTGSAATDLLISSKILESPAYAPATCILIKNGVGTLELTGICTYTGDTTVNDGTLVLADNARLTFVITDTSGDSNQLSGTGAVTLAGDFAINTSAVTSLTTGTWQLENVPTLTAYGTSFTVMDPDGTVWTNAGSEKLTKTVGAKAWSFDETTGTLTLSSTAGYASWIAGFGLPVGDQDPTDDPDADGMHNLIEYALAGRNPALSDGPAGTFTSGLLSFAKRADATGIAYAIQESDDLNTNDPWATVTPTTNTATEITWQMLPADRAKRFARLQVIQLP